MAGERIIGTPERAVEIAKSMLKDRNVGYLTRSGLEKIIAGELAGAKLPKDPAHSFATRVTKQIVDQIDDDTKKIESINAPFAGLRLKKVTFQPAIEDAQSVTIYYSQRFLTEQEARARYEQDAIQAANERKAKEEADKKELEARRQAERDAAKAKEEALLKPPTITIAPVAYIEGASESELRDNLVNSKLKDPEAAISPTENYSIPSLIREDEAKEILKHGIKPEELSLLVATVRAHIRHEASNLQRNAQEAADKILEAANATLANADQTLAQAKEQGLGRRGRELVKPQFVQPAYVQRTMEGLIYEALVAKTEGNERITVDLPADAYPQLFSIRSAAYLHWIDRYAPDKLPAYLEAAGNLAANGDANAAQFLEVLNTENAFAKLQEQGFVTAGEKKLTTEQVDDLLAPILLNDEDIIRGIAVEVMRQGIVDRKDDYGGSGEHNEIGLGELTYRMSAKMIANIFQGKSYDFVTVSVEEVHIMTEAEIKAVQRQMSELQRGLMPNPPKGTKKIQGKEERRKAEEEMKELGQILRTNVGADKAKEEADRQRAEQQTLLNSKKANPVASAFFDEAILILRAIGDPHGKNYDGGAASPAFKTAQQNVKELNPLGYTFKDPRESDYIEDETGRIPAAVKDGALWEVTFKRPV